MTTKAKLMPNLDQQSTKQLNLTVLQRNDSFIEDILFTSAHVTLYEFNIDLSQWSRKDVEGSLFVIKRSARPWFQFIVMNRRNTENLVENLLEDFEFEVNVPYLLYKNAAQEVNGVWFYSARDCEEVANLFNRILSAFFKVPQNSKVSTTKSESGEAVSTMTVMDLPLESSSSTTSNAGNVPGDHPPMNFFSTAMTSGNASTACIGGQPYHPSAPIPLASVHHTNIVNPSVPTLPTAVPLSASSHLVPRLDTHDIANKPTNLVKPSTFFTSYPSSSAQRVTPVSSSFPTASALNPPSFQHSYSAPLLQPFPPPTPPPSLTPAVVPTPNSGPMISRDKVRDALLVLVQDNEFIGMVYRALLNAHQSTR